MRDVRRALLDADVNFKVAKQFTDTVKTKAIGQNVLTSVKPKEQMVKIVHDELASLMGGDAAEILTSLGYKVVNLKGGIIEWKEVGLPVVSEQEN